MYAAHVQEPHSHYSSRNPNRNHDHHQIPALVHTSSRQSTADLPVRPAISHQPPTPSDPSFAGEQQQRQQQQHHQQVAAPGAFAPGPNSQPPPPGITTAPPAPGLLHPSHQRQRSTSLGQQAPQTGIPDLKRSHSLNENMSNPQTAAYYPMASPMAAYSQQLYGQNAMAQSNYYQPMPNSVPMQSGYMGARNDLPQMDYYQTMPYSQSSYPTSYATSYGGAAGGAPAAMGSAYGSPMSAQTYPRPAQPAPLAGAPPVQVVDRAKKPQCWDHGCNGREFSTFSNLLRHQREKSGTAAKSYCPNCGAEFTRTTARNGHMEHGKCKTRRAGSAAS